jgi:hypothetical protein
MPTGWSYKGCWVDQAHGRILGFQQPDNPALTVESCSQTCAGLGYSISGMEWISQCFCDNAIINQGTLASADTECNTACSGNSKEICGGGGRMSIYSNQTNVYVKPVPVAQTTNLPGNWTYQGCLT